MSQNFKAFTLAANDRIFIGEGLFETIKVAQSIPLFSELHWHRMSLSAQDIGLDFVLSVEDWNCMLLKKIQEEGMLDGGIKVIFTGGKAARDLIAKGQDNQFLLHCFSFSQYLKPVHLIEAPWTRDANNPIYQVKTINYLEAIFARRIAKEKNADDVLFFNNQAYVTEASCANIFFIQDDKVLTPSLSDGVLAGITRSRILNHCQQLNIEYDELSITREIMDQAEAVFLCNSLQNIYSVCSIEQKKIPINHSIVNQLKTLLAEEEKQYTQNVSRC